MFSYFKDDRNIVYAYDETQTPKEGLIAITEEEKDEIHRIEREKEFDSLSYANKRLSKYPPMQDYIDGIVKNDQKQIDEYIAKCLLIKSQYPK
jgi:hypothetical protein